MRNLVLKMIDFAVLWGGASGGDGWGGERWGETLPAEPRHRNQAALRRGKLHKLNFAFKMMNFVLK